MAKAKKQATPEKEAKPRRTYPKYLLIGKQSNYYGGRPTFLGCETLADLIACDSNVNFKQIARYELVDVGEPTIPLKVTSQGK